MEHLVSLFRKTTSAQSSYYEKGRPLKFEECGRQVLCVVGILQDETDPMVSVMKVGSSQYTYRSLLPLLS